MEGLFDGLHIVGFTRNLSSVMSFMYVFSNCLGNILIFLQLHLTIDKDLNLIERIFFIKSITIFWATHPCV